MGVDEGIFEERLEGVEGEVVKVTFHSEDGYTVLRFRTQSDEFTCTGHFARIGPGDRLRVTGKWVVHPRYGTQLSIESYEIVPPHTVDGIARYLGSGLIKGIGKEYAQRIVEKFGEKTLEIIDRRPERLLEVEGIGRSRLKAVKKAWREERAMSELVMFLESHGVRATSALKIYKRYGGKAIEIVRENPYRLASDIWGIGFVTADKIAYKLGIDPESVIRIRAGITYVLGQATDEGHVFLPREFLSTRCVSLLGVGEDSFDDALDGLRRDGEVVIEDENVYLPHLHEAETSIVVDLKSRLDLEHRPDVDDVESTLLAIERAQGVTFDGSQLNAISRGLRSGFTVITGGPGTGKTTIVQAFVRVYESNNRAIALAAPTGRAAKRMSEVTGREAKTIHRLLEFNPKDNLFRRNEENPIEADLIVVDEASMLDIMLASALLKAVKSTTSVVFVGDVDQLPPVGPGNFLKDLINSDCFPVHRLTQIFRQDETSTIVENAHSINRGEFPEFSRAEGDFFLFDQAEPAEVANTIVDLVSARLPARFGFDRFADIQVLSPMYKGDAGATNLNAMLQQALNSGGKRMGDLRFREGDKVMQLRNNYEKMVFNGDIGRVLECDPEEGKLTVNFDFPVEYDRSELDEITLAYAVTVHKSQGSEFPCIVMPVLTQHYIMLFRKLLYTAVTRAKKLVVLVGSRRAVGIAVRNVRTDRRYSALGTRLKAAIPS
ncbi:MAG: ATP-dependent RecD-like DNA helicase [bacterium]